MVNKEDSKEQPEEQEDQGIPADNQAPSKEPVSKLRKNLKHFGRWVGIVLAAGVIWQLAMRAWTWSVDAISYLCQVYYNGIYEAATHDPTLLLVSARIGFCMAVLLLIMMIIILAFTGRYRPPWLPKESRARVHARAGLALAIVLIVALVFQVVSSETSHDIKESFFRRVVILSPYMEDKDRKLLESRFFRMTTRADYDTIVADLEKIAKENDITLLE